MYPPRVNLFVKALLIARLTCLYGNGFMIVNILAQKGLLNVPTLVVRQSNKLHLFTAHILQLTKALGSTGDPQTSVPAVPCTNITKWPGGDMYIRVDANHYEYVDYTLTVKVISSATSLEEDAGNPVALRVIVLQN